MCAECRPSTAGPLSREWVLTDTAHTTQLGSRERVMPKVEKVLAASRTAAAPEDGRRQESDTTQA